MGWIVEKKNSLPYFQCSSKVYRRKKDPKSMHNCEPVYWSFSIPLKINKSENSIIMFTGMENVYQSVLVSTDLFHKLYIQGLSEASELHRVRGNQWCIVGPLGQEHIVSPFLNEKWTVGEIKLRGVEWGTVKPLTWILHFTSAQLSLEPSSEWAQVPPLWGEKRAGGGVFTNKAHRFTNYN